MYYIDFKKSYLIQKEIKKLEHQCFTVTTKHRESVIELLKNLNIPFVFAEGEAELLCSYLQLKGIVDYVLSEDTDVLVYGNTKVIQTMRGTNRYFLETIVEDFLKIHSITHDQFVNMCILSGCDYTKAKQIKIDKCLEYVKKFDTLKQCHEELSKDYNVHELEEYMKIKQMYTVFDHVNVSKIIFLIKKKQASFLDKFDKTKIDNYLNSFGVNQSKVKSLCEYLQQSINHFRIILNK